MGKTMFLSSKRTNKNQKRYCHHKCFSCMSQPAKWKQKMSHLGRNGIPQAIRSEFLKKFPNAVLNIKCGQRGSSILGAPHLLACHRLFFRCANLKRSIVLRADYGEVYY